MRTPYITASLIAGAAATALGLEEKSSDFVVYFDGGHHGSHSYIRDDHGHHPSHGYGHYSSSDDYGHNLTSYSDSDHHGYHHTSHSSHGHGYFGFTSDHTSDGYSLPSSSYSYSDHHNTVYYTSDKSDVPYHLSLTSYSDAIHDSYSDVHHYNPYSELDELEAILHYNLAPHKPHKPQVVHHDYGYGYTHNPY